MRTTTRFLLIIVLSALIIFLPSHTEAADKPLVAITKQVLRKAAEIGINEAGSRVMGPTAWGYLKTVIKPIYRELEKRFPSLLLVGEPEAEAAAESAVAELSRDKDLQQLLVDNFNQLEEGQNVIIGEINRINKVLGTVGQNVIDGIEISEQILDKLTEQRGNPSMRHLKEVDHVERWLEKARTLFKSKQKEGELGEWNEATQFVVLEHNIRQQLYVREVLEHGKSLTTYTYVLNGALLEEWFVLPEPTMYYITTSSPFTDDLGRTCKDVWQKYEHDGQEHSLLLDKGNGTLSPVQQHTYCKERGLWQHTDVKFE